MLHKGALRLNNNMKCVYCLDFPDGKRYVGSTKDLEQRIKRHKSPTNGLKCNPELKAAILRGYYSVVILEQCPDSYNTKHLRLREQHYINLWFNYGILYNKNKDVNNGFEKGKPKSLETRAKMSAWQKGKPSPKKGKPSPKKGKKYSEAYQHADKIIADRAAGMPVYLLRKKYKGSVAIIKDILQLKSG